MNDEVLLNPIMKKGVAEEFLRILQSSQHDVSATEMRQGAIDDLFDHIKLKIAENRKLGMMSFTVPSPFKDDLIEMLHGQGYRTDLKREDIPTTGIPQIIIYIMWY